MSLRTVLLLSALLLPTLAVAMPMGPPFDVPARPDTPLGPPAGAGPPDGPPVAAPPIDLILPDAPGSRGPRGVSGAPIDSLPIRHVAQGPPNLLGQVDLPDPASIVFDVAPPFGGSGGGRFDPGRNAIPEPGTALLLASGLLALATRRHMHGHDA